MFGPHMLRKFPPQSLYSNPKNQFMQMNQMNQMFPNQFGGNQHQHQYQQPNFGNFPPQQMTNQVDPSLMSPEDRKEFFGDQLYTKISSNMDLSQFEE
jgi:hypothetical protein